MHKKQKEMLLETAIDLLNKMDVDDIETVDVDSTNYDDGSSSFTVTVNYPVEQNEIEIKFDGKKFSEISASEIVKSMNAVDYGWKTIDKGIAMTDEGVVVKRPEEEKKPYSLIVSEQDGERVIEVKLTEKEVEQLNIDLNLDREFVKVGDIYCKRSIIDYIH